MPTIRDDSAGSYGTWNNDDLSWLDLGRARASDVGNAAYNALANITGALTPIGTSPQGNMALQVPPAITGFVDSYQRLMNPEDPGSYHHLTGVPELDAPIHSDTNVVLQSLYGGNAVSGLAKQPRPVPSPMNVEKPVEAAIRYKGRVTKGGNHGEAYDNYISKYNRRFWPVDENHLYDHGIDGFITNHGRFVDRQEAGRLVNQFVPEGEPKYGPDFGSENLDDAAALASLYGGNALNPLRGRAGAAISPDLAIAQTAQRTFPNSLSVVDNPEYVDVLGKVAAGFQRSRADKQLIGANEHLIGKMEDVLAGRNSFNDGSIPEQALSPYEIGQFNQQIRQRKINDGTLFSDTGKPSILGSAMAGAGENRSFGSSADLAVSTSGAVNQTGMPVQAASRYGNEIFTGSNHGEAYQKAVDRFGESAVDDMLLKDGMFDGFVDAQGNFIDRITARERVGGTGGYHAADIIPDWLPF